MGRKKRQQQNTSTLEELREQVFMECLAKLHPNIRKKLEADGVLEAACYALAEN